MNMNPTIATKFNCGTCDSKFDDRDARETHLDNTGHGHRRLAERVGDSMPVGGAAIFERTRPKAGAPASNQYGTFTVNYATEKQTAFIGSLLARKDLGTMEPAEVATLREQVAANQINKNAASVLIDALLALPDAGAQSTSAAPAPQGRPATEKQMAFLKRLIAEKDFYSLVDSDRKKVTFVNNGGHPTAAGASALIDVLLVTANSTTEKVEIEAGVYTDGTDTFRVYLGQQSGRMLAAKVIEHDEINPETGKRQAEFVYAGAASRYVTSAFRKMTIEEAAKFGKATGTCIVCAHRLDVPESVDRGIGPVCFGKMGG